MEKKLILVNAVNFERMFWLIKDIFGYFKDRDDIHVFWSQYEMHIGHVTIKFVLDRMNIKGYKPDVCFGLNSWKMRDKEYPGTLMDFLDDELNEPVPIGFGVVPTESEG